MKTAAIKEIFVLVSFIYLFTYLFIKNSFLIEAFKVHRNVYDLRQSKMLFFFSRNE